VDARVQAQDQVFVPQDEEELRQGFYFCRSLILLMQRVFAALDLEREWQHVDHRGWMNALRQWAASGMLRITWAACATTYSRRFRAFGERRLGLTLGEVAAKSVFTGAPASHELEASGLSLHERQQVARLLPAAEAISLYRLDLIVQPPPPHDHRGVEFARFVFGYCVFRADNDELLMYRVRDHMRGVGLGRRGLRAVIEHRERPIRLGTIGGLTEILQSVGEQADAAQIVDFRALVFSVNAEWEATLGMTPPD
jgi:hypothetical protein